MMLLRMNQALLKAMLLKIGLVVDFVGQVGQTNKIHCSRFVLVLGQLGISILIACVTGFKSRCNQS